MIAAVRGYALGGGCELVLACDLVVASEDARFGLPEIRLGVFPPAAAALLPRLVGPRRALDLVLTGRTIGAQEALELGMVTKVAPRGSFEAEVEACVTLLAGLSRPVLQLTKRVLAEGGLDWSTPPTRLVLRWPGQPEVRAALTLQHHAEAIARILAALQAGPAAPLPAPGDVHAVGHLPPERGGAFAGQRRHEADRCAALDAVDEHVGELLDVSVGDSLQPSQRPLHGHRLATGSDAITTA